jgi:hypothetical protein
MSSSSPLSSLSLPSEKDISTIILVFPEMELFGEDYINFEIYTDILDDVTVCKYVNIHIYRCIHTKICIYVYVSI